MVAGLVLFGGYAPGLISAVALNLPVSVLVLRRAAAEQWFSRQVLRALVPAAIVLHLPIGVARWDSLRQAWLSRVPAGFFEAA